MANVEYENVYLVPKTELAIKASLVSNASGFSFVADVAIGVAIGGDPALFEQYETLTIKEAEILHRVLGDAINALKREVSRFNDQI